jgi:hypothetical protein
MRRRTRPSRLRKNSKNARKGKGTTGVPIAPGFGAMGWRSSTRAAKSLKIDSGFSSLRKKSVLRLILGGAAVYRCDKRLVCSIGFSR